MGMNERHAAISPARRRAMLDRALAKSQEQVSLNNLPRILRRSERETVWAVASRTEAGVIYLVTQSPAGELVCDCPADCLCWHKVHVSRAIDGLIGYQAAPPRPRLTPEQVASTIYGRRSA